MADEALSSFTTLIASVPGWIADMESILETATERQNNIPFENRPGASPKLPSRRPSKSSSLRSRWSRAGHKQEDVASNHSRNNLLRPQLPHTTQSDALRLSQRKRKTTSAISACSGRSGPSKYRSRAMVIIYYDGDIQSQFEKLVRAIGAARNTIRKGKTGAKVDSLSRNSSSSSDNGDSGGRETIRGLGNLNYKTTRHRRQGRTIFGGRNDRSGVFDKVDGLLEKSQTLCERAAHQILRDGDCAMEVSTAKEHVAEAQRHADAELPALRRKADKAAERRRRSEEQRRIEEAGKRQQRTDVTGNTKLIKIADGFPPDGKLEVDEEEADDATDDENFDITVIAMPAGKYQMRTPRLPA